MKKFQTLILDKRDVFRLVRIKDSIKAVESAFREYAKAKVLMPPKIYLHLDKHGGDFRAMPAYVEKLGKCVLKWVNVHPRNKVFGLPAVMAINILSDPANGFPLCIMDATYATSLRTGAAGAVAAKYLARKDSKIVGLIGCGVQAKTQLKALKELFDISEARVWGCKRSHIRNFIKDMKGAGLDLIRAKSIKECLKGSDIVVTTTPSRKPLVKLSWLKPGTHINAIGADARGKQELEPIILKKAKVVVDAWEQAAHSGEINVPLRNKLISRKDIFADIGEVAIGKRKGRTDSCEITVFDSTGLAIQDVAIANLIYKAALKKKIGKWIKFV